MGGGKPGARPRTLLVKDISYNTRYDCTVSCTALYCTVLFNTRYDVIDHVPGSGGEQLRMCLLTKTSLGRRHQRENI